VATRYDAAEFDDKKRDRYVRLLTNSVIIETKVDELATFIPSIETLREDDVIGLKVLNRVMNKPGDWNQPGPPGVLHPNIFLGRAQELAVQMAKDFGKWPPAPNNPFSREKSLQICLRLQGLGLAQELERQPARFRSPTIARD
jgi:hypothetical protein